MPSKRKSLKGNIEYTKKNGINLVAKLNPSVTQGYRKKKDVFECNKDAGMYVCKAGHMAITIADKVRKEETLIKRTPIISTHFYIFRRFRTDR